MADENKKSIIKSELNEVIDNLLDDYSIYRKDSINIATTYGVTTSGTSSTALYNLKLGINGEIIQNLRNVAFIGSVQIVNLNNGTLVGQRVLASLIGQYFMTDVTNTGTTAATTTGIQTTLCPPVHLGEYSQSSYFGGISIVPSQNLSMLYYKDKPLLVGGFLYDIKNGNIIIKGFRMYSATDNSLLGQMVEELNSEKEAILYATIPLFAPVTYTYEEE